MLGLAVLFLGTFGLSFWLVEWFGKRSVLARFERLVARRKKRRQERERVESLLRRRALAALAEAERQLVHQDFSREVSLWLRRADLDWRVSEFLALAVGCGAGPFLLVLLLLGNGPAALAAGMVGLAAPFGYLRSRQGSRRELLEQGLPDFLTGLANSLRAGYSLAQSMATACQAGSGPVAQEFAQAVAEMAVNVPMDRALEGMVRRVGSRDLELVVTVILVQRQVGGNLAAALDRLAEFLRRRREIRGQLRVLTAQARLSAWIISALPVALAVGLSAVSPQYMRVLVRTSFGWVLLGVGGALLALGVLWVSRVARVDV
ncbi:MAG: type II secretion system F family protein [Thermaerobacter sp.]|nr:type II secretion system F family protein [Thermaerobacter sp.]